MDPIILLYVSLFKLYPCASADCETQDFPSSYSQTMLQSKSTQDSEPKLGRAADEHSSPQPVNITALRDPPGFNAEPGLEPLRDAGGGKVRGPNGRYLPKLNSSPVSAKPRRKSGGSRVKFAEQRKFTLDGEVMYYRWPLAILVVHRDEFLLTICSETCG